MGVKAVTFSETGGPDVLRVTDLPDPEPGAGDAVIKVTYAGVNHFDIHLRQGFRFDLRFPHTPGLEASGDVVSVGADVDASLVGTAVMTRYLLPTYEMVGVHIPGSYAEYLRVPADSLIPKPATLSYQDAAAIPLSFSAAWRALTTRGSLQQGETVLITAASGAVGTAAMQLAKHLGARVIACSSSDEKLKSARELGADMGVNHRAGDVASAVRELTAGAGVDLVLDSVGGDLLEASMKALAHGGRIVTVGSMAGDDVTVNIPDMYLGEQALIASLGSTPEELDHVVDLAADRIVRPVIDRILPLAEAAEAHRAIEAGEVFGRVLLTP